MADDINISVGYQDVINADKAAIKLAKAFTDLDKAAARGGAGLDDLLALTSKLERANLSLSQVYKGIDADLNNAAKTSAKLETAYLQQNLASKSARESAKAMQAAFKEQESEAAKLAREVENLSLKYKPLYAASTQYEKKLNEINRAHQLGVVSTKQHEDAVENLNRDYTAFVNGTAGWSNQFVQGSNAAGKSANKLGMQVQGLGYQVGDFFVQVQSGTNWLVAFGQQATQALGYFGVGGALAGAVLAMGTALGAMYMRTQEAGKGVDDLGDKMKSFTQKGQEATDTVRAFNLGLKDTAEIGFVESIKAAQQEVKILENNYKQVSQFNDARTLAAEKELESARKRLSALEDEYQQTQASIAAEERLLKVREMADQAAKNYKARVAAEQETEKSLQSQLSLQRLIIQFGADSAAVAELKKQHALEEYEASLRDKGIKGQALQTLMNMKSAALDNANLISRGADAASRLEGNIRAAANAMSALTSFGAGIEKSLDVVNAKIKAVQSGASTAVAGQVAGMRADLEAKRSEALAAGNDPLSVMAEYAIDKAAVDEFEKQSNRLVEIQNNMRSSSSGGGGTSSLTLDKRETSLQSLMSQYMPTQDEFEQAEEKLMVWREKAQDALLNAQLKERGMLEEHNAYKLEIEQRYQDQMDAIQRNRQDYKLQSYESFFGTMANVFQSGGEKTLKISKAFGIAEATISMWRGAAKALELPYPANLAAWANVMATGAQAIAGIKSVTSGGGSSSSSASSASSASTSAATSTSTASDAPLVVNIEGLNTSSLYSGGQIKELFDAIFKENKSRGYILKVS